MQNRFSLKQKFIKKHTHKVHKQTSAQYCDPLAWAKLKAETCEICVQYCGTKQKHQNLNFSSPFQENHSFKAKRPGGAEIFGKIFKITPPPLT